MDTGHGRPEATTTWVIGQLLDPCDTAMPGFSASSGGWLPPTAVVAVLAAAAGTIAAAQCFVDVDDRRRLMLDDELKLKLRQLTSLTGKHKRV